jgi:hypothetical protein
VRVNTGQLEWSYGQWHELGELSPRVDNPFAVVLITTLDEGDNIADAPRLLLVALPRARNSGMVYSEDGRRLMAVGQAPVRLEPVRLELR